MYTNADGLLSKLEKAKVRLMTTKPDVFAIVDTAIQADEYTYGYCPDEVLEVEGYTVYRKDNPKERKGGILM